MTMAQPMAIGDLFTGQLVRLAAWGGTKEFNDALAAWSNDAEYVRNYNFRHAVPRSVEEIERRQKKALEKDKDNEFEFAIRTLEGDKLIGDCGIEPEWNHQAGSVWIGIGEADYWGKGYGTDAMRLLIGYGFRELGLHRISLNVFSGNPRAIRSYEKAGFRHEVTQRQALYRDGHRYDILIMGLLRPEWEAALDR